MLPSEHAPAQNTASKLDEEESVTFVGAPTQFVPLQYWK